MKKAVLAVLALIALAILALLLIGKFAPSALPEACVTDSVGGETDGSTPEEEAEDIMSQVKKGEELLAQVETEEEAEALAEQYGITLVRFRNGIATYHCEGNPIEVIQLGHENGWTLLVLNRVTTLSPIEGGTTKRTGTPSKPSTSNKP